MKNPVISHIASVANQREANEHTWQDVLKLAGLIEGEDITVVRGEQCISVQGMKKLRDYFFSAGTLNGRGRLKTSSDRIATSASETRTERRRIRGLAFNRASALLFVGRRGSTMSKIRLHHVAILTLTVSRIVYTKKEP
jgi:hypothetical protein